MLWNVALSGHHPSLTKHGLGVCSLHLALLKVRTPKTTEDFLSPLVYLRVFREDHGYNSQREEHL